MMDGSTRPNPFAVVVTTGAVEALPYVAPPPDEQIVPTPAE